MKLLMFYNNSKYSKPVRSVPDNFLFSKTNGTDSFIPKVVDYSQNQKLSWLAPFAPLLNSVK